MSEDYSNVHPLAQMKCAQEIFGKPPSEPMPEPSKGELSDLNLTSGQWHYVENASDGGLRQSLGDDNCQGDFAEAIRRPRIERVES